MDTLGQITLPIEFVKQAVDPGGGGGTITPAQTGDLLIWSILALLFIAVIAFCMFRFRLRNNIAEAAKSGNASTIISKRLLICKSVLISTIITLIVSFGITSFITFAQGQSNSSGFQPEKIQVIINEETGQATCDAFNLVNNTDNPYLFESSTLELTPDAKTLSSENDWDLTINAIGLGANLFNGKPGDYKIDNIKSLEPGQSSTATLSFNKVDTAITKQLIGKQVFNLILQPQQNVVEPPVAKEGLIYNAKQQTGVEPGEGYTLTGTYQATDADDYEATATLESGYVWSDKTTEPKRIKWSIDKAVVKEIDITGNNKTINYDGAEHTFPDYAAGETSYSVSSFTMEEGHSKDAFDASKINPPNNTSAITPVTLTNSGKEYLNLGTYKNDFKLEDKNIESSECVWNITEDGYLKIYDPNEVEIPVIDDITFDDKPHEPFTSIQHIVIKSGDTVGKDADPYSTIVVPADGYHWAGTESDKSEKEINWKIVPYNVILEFDVDEDGYTVQYGNEWTTAETEIITKQEDLPHPLVEIFPSGINASCDYSIGSVVDSTFEVNINPPTPVSTKNYTVECKNSKLTVIKRDLTLSWVTNPLIVEYDGAAHWPSYNLTGVYESDEPVIIRSAKKGSTDVEAPIAVGTYTISASLGDDSVSNNYDLQVAEDCTVEITPVESYLLLKAPESTEYGLLEDRFRDSVYNPLLATAVEFKKTDDFPEGHKPADVARNKDNPIDMSQAGDGSILGYVMDDQTANSYKLTIVSAVKIKANTNSLSRMFKNFRNLFNIDYSNLDTSIVTDASYMFEGAGRDDAVMSEIDFSSLSNGKLTFAEGCDLSYMFSDCNCSANLSALDTSKVSDMSFMFHNYCKSIYAAQKAGTVKNSPHLILSNTEDGFKIPENCSTKNMFDGCALNLCPKEGDNVIDQIDSSLAKDFSGMFKNYCAGQDGLTLNLTNLDTSKSKNMEAMFEGAFSGAGNSKIIFPDNFKLAPNVSGLLKNCDMHELDLSNADFSNVNNMSHFFENYGFKDILDEDYVKLPDNMVTAENCDASYMYANATIYPYVLWKWKASNITNMEGFFYNYGMTLLGDVWWYQLQNISFPENYKLAAGCSLKSMFKQAYCNVDLSNLDASDVTDFSSMFESFGSVVYDDDSSQLVAECSLNFGENFQTAKGANFSHMFDAIQILDLDLRHFNMNNGVDFSYMFHMVGQNLSLLQILETNYPVFTCKITFPDEVKPEPETSFFKPNVEVKMDYMFKGYRFNTNEDITYSLDVSMFNFENVTSLVGMFEDYNNFSLLGSCANVNADKNIILPETIITANDADMSYMFNRSNAFTSKITTEEAKGNQSNEINTCILEVKAENVKNLSHLFDSVFGNPYKNTTEKFDFYKVDISGFDFSNVDDISFMFYNSFLEELHPHGQIAFPEGEKSLVTSEGTNASHLFDGADLQSPFDITSIDFSKLENISYCFANLGNESAPLSINDIATFEIENQTNIEGLFYNSYLFNIDAETLDLTNWDVSKVTDMSYLFYNLKCKKLDISTWNPESCTNMEGMFKEFGYPFGVTAEEKSWIKFPDGDEHIWKTGKNCSMKFMFEMCIADVDLRGFDVEKVINMEGMFLGFGTNAAQIEKVLESIFKLANNGQIKQEEALDVYALVECLIGKTIEESAGQYINNTANAASLLVDSRTSLAKNSLSTAISASQDKKIEVGDNGLISENASLDPVSAANVYDDVFASANVNPNDYAAEYNNTVNEVKNESIRDIGNALSDLLGHIDLNKYEDIILKALDNSAVPNFASINFSIIFPDDANSFMPGNKENPCSMKAMFAFCNVLCAGIVIDGGIYEDLGLPSFLGFNTEYVNDMSFMFAGYYLASVFIEADTPQVAEDNDNSSNNKSSNVELNVSSFNTKNVRDMTGMFALTGICIIFDANEEIYRFSDMNIVFSHEFTINSFDEFLSEPSICNVSFMFAGCFANLEKIEKITTSNAKSLAFMFTLCNCPYLDISEWDTSNAKDMKYMFALYGGGGIIVDALLHAIDSKFVAKTYHLNIGSSEEKFKIGADVDVARMFMLSIFTELNLTNIDTSEATNLSKMFQFCFMGFLDSDALGIDISTWDTSKVVNFNSMFMLTITTDVKLSSDDSKLETGPGATMDSMFKYAYIDKMIENDYSEKGKAISFDVSCINFENVYDMSSMFQGFNLISFLMYRDSEDHMGSSINFGSQNITNCAKMDRMFELCPMGVDMSGVSVAGLKDLNRMFAFSGYTYFDIDTSVPAEYLALRTLGAYFTEIKFPEVEQSFKTAESGASAEYMFLGSKSGDLTKIIDPDPGITNVDSIRYSLTPSTFNMSFLQSENITNMRGMFMLHSGSLNLTKFNISKCIDACNMFSCYGILNAINVLLAFTSDMTTITGLMDLYSEIKWPDSLTFNSECQTYYMFSQYLAKPNMSEEGYKYNFNFINVSNLKRFDYMFAYGFGIYNYDISSWNISSATSLNHMFQGHGLLFNIAVDAITWYVKENPDLLSILYGVVKNNPVADMKIFPLPVSAKYNGTINMVGMFSWATISALKINEETNTVYLDKTLDLRNWDMSSVENASYAFAGYGLGFTTAAAVIDDLEALLTELELLEAKESESNEVANFKASFSNILFSKEKVKFANGVNLKGMFALADSNVDFSGFDASNVANFDAMFAGFAPSFSNTADSGTYFDKDARQIKLQIPNDLHFDYGSGVSLYAMFMSYHPDNLDVSNWDITNVTDLTSTFEYCNAKTLDVYNWRTPKVTSMSQTFTGANINCVDCSEWDFSKVTNMYMMFAFFGNDDGRSLIYFPVSGMTTAPNCNADYMFYSSRLSSILLYGLNIENISSVDYMFAYSENLQRIHVADSIDWTNKKLAGTYMFLDCYNLVGSNGTSYMAYHTNIEYARTDKGVMAPGYFSTTHSLREPSNYKTAKEDSEYKSIFLGGDNYSGFTTDQLKDVTKVEFKTADVSSFVEDDNNIDISYSNDASIFASLNDNVITVTSEGIIYSRQKSLVNMFAWDDSNLATVDFSGGLFDTIAADSTYGMFAGCEKLIWIKDINLLNTLNVINMQAMFKSVGSSTVDGCCIDFGILSDPFNVLSWTSNFNTYYVKNMSEMFRSAKVYSSWIDESQSPINLITFDFTNVEDMSYMFNDFRSNTVKFSSEKASVAPKEECNFQYMFANSEWIKYVDLAGFAIPNKAKLDNMFYASTGLETIYVGSDFKETNNWTKIAGITSDNMFYGCSSLKGDNGTTYASGGPYDITFALPDKTSGGLGGYFSTTVKLDLAEFNISTEYVTLTSELNVNFIKNSNIDMVNAQKASSVLAYTSPYSPIVVYCLTHNDQQYPQMQVIFGSNQDMLPCDKKETDTPEDDVLTCEDMFHKGFFGNEIPDTLGIGHVYNLITKITFDNIDFTDTTSTKNMFSGLSSLTKLNFYNAKGDLSNVTDASNMFSACWSLITVDATNWHLNANADISLMFLMCSSLKTIYVDPNENWSNNPCTTDSVFFGCVSLVGNGWCEYDANKTGKVMAKIPVNEESPGYFTYGALLMNYDAETDHGIAEYIMEQYYQKHPISFVGRVAHDVVEWYQKQLITSIDFYRDFESTDDYKLGFLAADDDKDIIDISQNHDGSVFAYVYKYYAIECPDIIADVLPFLAETYIPLFRVAISTPPENTGKQIIADTESLKYMFRGLNFIDYANICEGWSGVNFSRDIDPEEFLIFNTSAARSAKGMFMDTYSFGANEHYNEGYPTKECPTLDLTQLDTSSVNDFSYMFWHCQIGDLKLSTALSDEDEEKSKFSIKNATNLSRMFESFGRLSILSYDELGDNPEATFLINYPTKLSLPKNMKTNNLCDASYMFYFTHIMDLDMTRLVFDNFYNMDCMYSFAGAFRLSLDDINITNNNNNLYEKLKELAIYMNEGNAVACETWLKNYYVNSDRQFGNGFCSVLTFNQDTYWGPLVNCSANEMFRGCTCSRIYADRFFTSNITSMRAMFQLTPFIQYMFVDNRNDIGRTFWDTSKVEDMSQMFSYCGSIDGTSRFGVFEGSLDPETPGDWPTFEIMKDCKVGRMFERCNLPVNLENCVCADDNSKFGLNNVRDYAGMFYEYAYFALPQLIGTPDNLTIALCTENSVSSWKPLENSSMYEMFRGCKANIDLRKLDFSSVNDFGGMFMSFGNGDVEDLYYNVGIKFPEVIKTAENANMSRMFKGYKGYGYAGDGTKAPDFSIFDTSKVVNMSEMFRGCKLKTLDLSTWDTSKVRDFSYMFSSELLRESYVGSIKLGLGFVIDEAVDLTCMFGSDLVDNDILRTIECPNNWASVIENRLKTEVVWTDSMFAGCYKLVGNALTNPTTYDADYLDYKLAKPGYVDADGEHHRGYFTYYEYQPTNKEAIKIQDKKVDVIDKQQQEDINAKDLDPGEAKEIIDPKVYDAFKDGFIKSASELAEPLTPIAFNIFRFFSGIFFMFFVAE